MNSEGRGKEGFVRKLFDTISPRYDLFNRLSSFGLDRRWRKRTIEHLHLLPGMRVLDLATGTGDLAHAAVQPLVPLGLVVGCDLSGDMLSCAQKKLSESPAAYWHVQLTQGRAEALPFLSNSFDGVTMGFALRNVTDLNGTLREFHRVLKPGGRVSLLELGRPEGFFIRWGHRLWLMIGVPLIGMLTTGRVWPFMYLRRSILQFLSPEQMVKELEEVSFQHVCAEQLTCGTVVIYHALRL